MSTPHRCPVCFGCGKDEVPPYGETGNDVSDAKVCPCCKGTCMVWEPDEPDTKAGALRKAMDDATPLPPLYFGPYKVGV